MSSSTLSQPSAALAAIYAAAAASTGVPEGLLIAQGRTESGFQTDVVSPSGAIGVSQFMPATAASMGVNPRDPTSSIYGQAKLMASYLGQYGGSVADALAAYNAGPGAVNAAGGVPAIAETQNYVTKIMSEWTGQTGVSDLTLQSTSSGWLPVDASGNPVDLSTATATTTGLKLPGLGSIPGVSQIKQAVSDAIDSAASSLFNAVKPVVIGGIIVAGGVGLIVAGGWRTVSGARGTLDDALDPAGSGGEL